MSVDLMYPDAAVDQFGNIGTWTMIYNQVQGDHLNMAFFSGTLEKVTCPVYAYMYSGRHVSPGTKKTRSCLTSPALYTHVIFCYSNMPH